MSENPKIDILEELRFNRSFTLEAQARMAKFQRMILFGLMTLKSRINPSQ